MLAVYVFKFFFCHKQTFLSVIHNKDDSANRKTKQTDNFFQKFLNFPVTKTIYDAKVVKYIYIEPLCHKENITREFLRILFKTDLEQNSD